MLPNQHGTFSREDANNHNIYEAYLLPVEFEDDESSDDW